MSHTLQVSPETEEEHETMYNRLVHARQAGILDFEWNSSIRRFTVTFLPRKEEADEVSNGELQP